MAQANVPMFQAVDPCSFYNNTGSTIAANLILVADSGADRAAKLPVALSSPATFVGVTMRSVPTGTSGTVAGHSGDVAVCTASGSVAVGDIVFADTATGKVGYAKTYTAAQGAALIVGTAMSAAADGELFEVRICSYYTSGSIGSGASMFQAGASRTVRGVVTSNISDLTAFTVASNDGLTYAAGDRVLLAGQTTASQNGIYVVGTVASTTAPLTRAADFITGMVYAGMVVEVSAGTLFAQSTWKLTTSGSITVDTTSINFYPRIVTQSVTLVAGTSTLSNVPLLSATKSAVFFNRTTANTCAATIQYNASTLTPGIVGTASIVVQAQVAAGTINSADISTLNVTVVNW